MEGIIFGPCKSCGNITDTVDFEGAFLCFNCAENESEVGRVKQTSKEQREEMYSHYQSGLSMTKVGAKYGITRQAVEQHFMKMGYETRKQGRGAKKTSEELVLIFIKEFITENGYPPSINEIGKGVGVTKNSVVRYLKKLEQQGFIVFVGYRRLKVIGEKD